MVSNLKRCAFQTLLLCLLPVMAPQAYAQIQAQGWAPVSEPVLRPEKTVTQGTTTNTTTHAPVNAVDLDNGEKAKAQLQVETERTISPNDILVERVRKDAFIAYKIVRDPWFWQTAQGNPAIVAAICAHAGPAKILAKYDHLTEVADADHYLCRRLTKWRAAAQALASNPHNGHVIALDPQGMYTAMQRDPKVARLLAKNILFSQMVVENPDLGKEVASHIKGLPFE